MKLIFKVIKWFKRLWTFLKYDNFKNVECMLQMLNYKDNIFHNLYLNNWILWKNSTVR